MTVDIRRAAAAIVCVVVLIAVSATPADAHTLTGIAATNYRSEVVSVAPATNGVAVRLLELGRQIEVRNDTNVTITILGYYDEPYLQVGPAGTFENTNSPSTYTNRTPTEVPPTGVSVTSPPQWHQISRSHVVRWRDQRSRWEGQDPLEVRQSPGSEHVVRNWQLTLRTGDTSTAGAIFVLGTITWIPPPTTAPWLVLLAIVAIVAFVGSRGRRANTWLAGAVATIVAVDIVSTTGGVAFSTSGALSILATLITRDPLASFAWISGLGALIALRRGESRAILFAGLTGWILTITSGIADADVFSRSVIPTRIDPSLTRLYTALTLGIGIALALTGALALLEERRRPRRSSARKPVSKRRR